MIAVIFELEPRTGMTDRYLEKAADLKPLVEGMDGFISVERFQSLANPGKYLSLSFWRDEDAVKSWRELMAHREAQRLGRAEIFQHYRLRVAQVVRDYGMSDRAQVPDGAVD